MQFYKVCKTKPVCVLPGRDDFDCIRNFWKHSFFLCVYVFTVVQVDPFVSQYSVQCCAQQKHASVNHS